jgi:hypothetical protein
LNQYFVIQVVGHLVECIERYFLITLMDEDEYEELTAINNTDSLKQAIDRF